MWLLLGLAACVVVLWHLAVTVAGWLSSAPARPRLQESLAAILRSPFNPLAGYGGSGLPPAWLVWLLFVAGMTLTVSAVWWWMLRRKRRPRREGIATAKQLAPFLGEQAARKLARQTRPRMEGRDRAPIAEVAMPMGRESETGQPLFASHEDSVAVVAGPRSFKTSAVLVDAVRSAPGPCIAVSTKADLLEPTYLARKRKGRVWVFDPTDIIGWPTGLRWSPIAGCEDPDAAVHRAEGFIAAMPKDANTRNADFFDKQAQIVVRCFLHAAALSSSSWEQVVEWSHRIDSPTLPPKTVLRSHPGAAPLYALQLETATSGNIMDGPVDSTAKTLAGMMAPFASPRLLSVLSPEPGEGFDVPAFLNSSDTIYIMTGDGESSAPLVTAFVNEIIRVARRTSQRLVPPRLDPPLRVVIDEVGQCPLPNLPPLMSDSGGRGVTVLIGSQGLGQARRRWGEDGANEVFSSATAKLIMGGTSENDFLERMSQLADEVDVESESTTLSHEGGQSVTTGYRTRRVIRPAEIRQLPPAHALLLYRQAPATIARFAPWWEAEWADDARASQREVAAIIAGAGLEGMR
ncbi:TraM recognition domain-containing protein [Actinoplanes sp. NPDC051851]|uniref:type IV secretory system conjugative DNA transfer family protein n=1 Tax=Actinoplanes sp. NPDC051851 TaxID=3154753 RepID=UPI00343455B8